MADKPLIAPLRFDGKEIYSLDELKQEFTVDGLISCRKRLFFWLKNRGEEGKEIAKQIEPLEALKDDEWVKQVSKILGCEEKYKHHIIQKAVDLIRFGKVSEDTVKLIRLLNDDDVKGHIPPEEWEKFKEAAKKKDVRNR